MMSYALSSLIIFGISTIFHTFICHSHRVADKLRRYVYLIIFIIRPHRFFLCFAPGQPAKSNEGVREIKNM